MRKRLSQLNEEDFMVFNGPLASGRQSPEGLAGTLLFAPILLIGLVGLANMFVFMNRSEPAHQVVIVLCIVLSVIGGIIALLSIIYSFQKVYETRQSMQYWISIWLSQFLFGHLLYWISLYMIFDGDQFHHRFNVSGQTMVLFVIGTFLIGLVTFFIFFVRLVIKIEKGEFRKKTKRDQLRSQLEESTGKFQGFAVKTGIALTLALTSLVKIFEVNDLETFVISVIGITLFFVMWFILPEQIITWYCIKRFESFNYKGDMNPS